MEIELTLAALESTVEKELPDEPISISTIALPWAFWSGWLGAAVAFGTAKLWSWMGLSPDVASVLVIAGLYVEIGGFAIALLIPLLRAMPGLKGRRGKYAKELDGTFEQVTLVVRWLRRYPPAQRVKILRFVEAARETMTYRMGLVLGGFERLGMFPILLALYFQLRDLKGGMTNVMHGINWVATLCLLMAVLLYAAGWLLVRHKSQLSGYAQLLAFSLEED